MRIKLIHFLNPFKMKVLKLFLNPFYLINILIVMFGLLISSCSKTEINKAPVITSILINPSSIPVSGTVSITVVATDPDGDALTYSYTPNGGAINGIGPAVTWTAPANAGTYSVTVKVSDGKTSSEQSAALTVTPNSTVTSINGTAYFPAGVSGDLSNAKVSLYTTLDNWKNNVPIKYVATIGSGSSVTFSITNVLPGNYYLDVWKDIDNDAFWSVGDFVGWYGAGGLGAPSLTELQIIQGQSLTVTVPMYIY